MKRLSTSSERLAEAYTNDPEGFDSLKGPAPDDALAKAATDIEYGAQALRDGSSPPAEIAVYLRTIADMLEQSGAQPGI